MDSPISCYLADADGGTFPNDWVRFRLPAIGYERYLEDYFNRYADSYADGILLGAGGEITDDSVVRDTSWGRIKASLR